MALEAVPRSRKCPIRKRLSGDCQPSWLMMNRLPRTLTRESLAQAGFGVSEAEDGSKARQSFKETSPGLVVLDAEMANVDDVEACAASRCLPPMAKAPVASGLTI